MDFTLRPMEPADGPALDALLTTQATATAVAMSTRYRYDVFASLIAQHPSLYGVVATAPGVDGLVGMATAYIDDVQVEDRLFPCAHLENLKVRDDVRRQGLGRKLAEWRIAEARRRFGDEGVIVAGVEATNAASLATARKWAGQIMGPLRIAIVPTTRKASSVRGYRIRGIEDDDVEAIVAGSNAFNADANLYPRLTGERLRELLAPMDPGGPVRQYRVAVTPAGNIVAGAVVVQRFELMTDHIDRLPTPLALAEQGPPSRAGGRRDPHGRGLAAVVRTRSAPGGAAPLGGDPPRMAWPGDPSSAPSSTRRARRRRCVASAA